MRRDPSWRTAAGMFGILALIALLAWVVASLIPLISHWFGWAQMLVYAVAGTVWIAPLKPLLKWMETGTFRR